MPKKFNITGDCKPSLHYMVDLTSRLAQIKALIDDGQYFVINRARQYGKTTTLSALEKYIDNEYIVFSLDFQTAMSSAKFADEYKFSSAFAKAIIRSAPKNDIPDDFAGAINALDKIAKGQYDLVDLFEQIGNICSVSPKPTVLIIDEVDSASNNQVFLDFLAQLRGCYLNRDTQPTFRSVILAGVHDIRNIQQKIRSEAEHKYNSPWNIASSFDVDMSFSPEDISGMLREYEQDCHTGMDIHTMAEMIYDYTSGYPVLVSHLCKLMDESSLPKKDSWTLQGLRDAVKKLLTLNTPLFESLVNKLEQFPELKRQLEEVLENGRSVPYRPDDEATKQAIMYGFVKVSGGNIVISNRIFETRFYDMLLTTPDIQALPLYHVSESEKQGFISGGHLNMELVLERFVQCFTDIYGSEPDTFIEEDGRKLFLLFLRPIINGTGNYYIEAQTRDRRRTDVIVDYLGEQFIIEMKIWHGEEYNTRGEQQLTDYLNYYHVATGYLLSFNFNKNKEIGLHTVKYNDKTIVEAVV